MTQRLLGVETEYALSAEGPGGTPRATEAAVLPLINVAKERLRHLPDIHSGGVFLENSMRFYVDSGMHPELATPECTDPRDVVRYIAAGERILVRLAAALVASQPGFSAITLLKCNVDYSGTQSTWGCHESYLHQADPPSLPAQIVPHLVSRLVYAGAGGFNTVSRSAEFILSPRVPHLVRTVSSASTHDRGIFHTKGEPLAAGGYHRLHILAGESLCSEFASWLKLGTTALIVAMVEGGLRPGDAVALRSPLAAIRRFARDESCTAAVCGKTGRKWTALAIQRHYHELAAKHAHEPFMPSWAPELIDAWGAVLDRLHHGAPDSVATLLDWAIKLTLYRDRARQRGLRWPDLRPPAGLRAELFEIDARFGQLGERAIFAALDRAGVLDHHVQGIDRIEDAVHNPPAEGRAHLRGLCIKRFADQRHRYAADWQSIWDSQRCAQLDLSNPFETKERWRKADKGARPRCRPGFHGLLESLGLRREAPPTPEGYRVGDRVLLARPQATPNAAADEGWTPGMERYVGHAARIVNILHVDERAGCSLVQVDADRGRWAWRTRDLRPAADGSSVPF